MKWDIALDSLDINVNGCISNNYDDISVVRNVEIYKELSDKRKIDLLIYKLDSLSRILKEKNNE